MVKTENPTKEPEKKEQHVKVIVVATVEEVLPKDATFSDFIKNTRAKYVGILKTNKVLLQVV